MLYFEIKGTERAFWGGLIFDRPAPMNDKAQNVRCPTCGAPPGKPCRRESGKAVVS